MSDTNDKKPIPPIPGWPSSNEQGQPQAASGQAMEDPLAELDRIVNQDFDFAASPKGQPSGQPAAVSQEELRELEQELIRELRLQQGLDDTPRPAEPAEQVAPQPVSQPAAPSGAEPAAEAVADRSADPLMRPHPLAPKAPIEPKAPADAQADALAQSLDQAMQASAAPLRGSQAASFALPEETNDGAVAQEEAPVAPPVSASPRSEPSPAAVTASERRAPSLDDWSSLIRGGASTEPVAPEAPSREQAGLSTSGSYGQLSRPSQRDAAPRETAQTDPMASFRPGQPMEKPASSLRQDDFAAWSQPSRDAEAGQEAPDMREPEGYAHQPVPEVRAPVTSDPASDPFAAFNQAPAAPAAQYPDPMREAPSAAPAVDVSGRDYGYAGYSEETARPSHYDAGYQDQSYQQGYGQADAYGNQQTYGSADDYPMASGPHGTYADPGVAQAAAESSPYVGDDDYSALDPDMMAQQPAKTQKSRKGLIAALAAVGVIAVGGLVVWGFGQSGTESTGTPVVEAKTDPVKEVPDDPGGKVIPNQNAAVYDRIDGTASDEGPSTLMPATEQPLALTRDGQAPRVISLSGGETNVAQTGDTNSSTNPVRPKEVRTVVVRPDGTIVTANSGDAASTANTNAQTPSVDQELLNQTPSEQAMNSTFNNGIDQGGLLQGSNASSNANAGADTVSSGLPLPRAKPDELVALQQAAQATTPAPAQPVAQQPAANRPTVLAPQNSPAQPIAAQPAAQTNSAVGGYTVQITSQRTPDQARASFANIQARLPILSGYQPDIKQADLGDRGTFYRVRVGSFGDRAGATAFCQSIKNSGGDCLVARQ